MAEQKRKISYGIDFEVNDAELKKLKKQLEQLKKLSVVNYASQQGISLNSPATAKKQAHQLAKLKKDATEFQRLMRLAYNPKTNSYNITKFNLALKKSKINATSFREEMQKAAEGRATWAAQTNELTKFNTELKQSHKLLDSLGTTLMNTIKWTISSSIMQGVTRSISQAYGFAKNLDSALNDIRIVTGKSADEMARFAERANTVASNLGKGTNDYTRAALIYAQQGLGQKEIEEKTAITLKTANVTEQSTEEVSEELTAVWNGYKVSADEAELYVDRLAAVAATTASDLQELSTSMSKVASAAAAMGVGEDQLAAQLSTIISVTRQAPETVGTALRTVYARITDIQAGIDEDGVTLGKYSGDMAKIGFNVLDVNGKLRDMGEVMEEIGNKWKTLTKEQQISLAQTMAGQRQYSNLIALFDNFDKYQSALNTAQNAGGKLQEQQDIYMDRLSTHVQQLTTATEHMWMGLVDTDGFKDIIDGLTTIVEKVDKLFRSIGGGKNLLQSLVPIVMSLTSKTVASGINTMIINSQLEKRQLRDQKSSQALAQNEMKALQSEGQQGSQRYQVWKQKSEFLQAAPGTFSAQQMDEINKRWSGSLEAAEAADKARSDLADVSGAVEIVSGINPLDTKVSIDTLEGAIETASKSYKNLSKSVNNFIQQQNATNQSQDEAQKNLINAYNQVVKKEQEIIQEENERQQVLSKAAKKFGVVSMPGQPIEGTTLQQLSKKVNAAQRQKQTSINNIQQSIDFATVDQGQNFLTKKAYGGIANSLNGRTITQDQFKALEQLDQFQSLKNFSGTDKEKALQQLLSGSIFEDVFNDQEQKSGQVTQDKFIVAIKSRVISLKQSLEKAEQELGKIQNIKNNFIPSNNYAQRSQLAAQDIQDAQNALKNQSQTNLTIQRSGEFTQILDILNKQLPQAASKSKEKLLDFSQRFNDINKKVLDFNTSIGKTNLSNVDEVQKLIEEREKLIQEREDFLQEFEDFSNDVGDNIISQGEEALQTQRNADSITENNDEANNDIQDDAERQKAIQSAIQLVSALGQVQMGFENFLNIFQIVNDDTLDVGEKISQTLNNLMITVPMLVTSIISMKEAYTSLNGVQGVHQLLQKKITFSLKEQLILLKTNIVEKSKNLFITLKDIPAKLSDAIANKTLSKSLKEVAASATTANMSIGASLAVLAAVVIAIAAIKTAVESRNKQAQQTIKLNEELIEKEKEKQETISHEKDIISEVKQLNEQYKNGIITRQELKEKTEQLQEKYKDESDSIKELVSDYTNLDKALQKIQDDNDLAQLESDKNMATYKAAIAKSTEEGAVKGNEWWRSASLAQMSSQTQGKTVIQVGLGETQFGSKLATALSSRRAGQGKSETSAMMAAGTLLGGGLGAQIGQELSKNSLTQVDINDISTKAQLKSLVEGLKDAIDQATEDETDDATYLQTVQLYNTFSEQLKEWQAADLAVLHDIAHNTAKAVSKNFNFIDNFEEYQKAYSDSAAQMYKKLSNSNQKYGEGDNAKTFNELTKDEQWDIISSELEKVIPQDLKTEYGDRMDALNLYNHLHGNGYFKSGKKNDSSIVTMVEGLNEDQLKIWDSYLDDAFQANLTTEQINQTLDYIANHDFSKLTFNEAEAEKAAQTYNNMANALEKIQNGKGISKKDFETYGFTNDDELKDLFRFGNSGYILKDPADQKKVEELIKQRQRSGWDAKYLANEEKAKNNQKWIKSGAGSYKIQEWTTQEKVNNQNAQQMIEHLERFATDSQTQVELQMYKDQITNNNKQVTEEVYNNIYDLYNKLQLTYQNAEKDAEEAVEAQKEALQNIHDTVFPTDKDVNETIIAQLGEQFQLTAQKSKLLDDALKDNAQQAREVAEQVQRYDAALKSVIKNYGNWSNALQNGSTAEKLATMPQIKNSIADTLGISDNVISNSFATTTENLENMRKALQGDKQAYKDLQAAMYEDIIAHVGLDDKDLIEAKGLIEKVFNSINLDDIEVGATLDDAQVQKVLNRLIEMGIDSAETLEAIFATYYDVDLDVDIINGKAKILSLTKAATHELKQQQKSQEELKNLERDRIKNQKELTKFLKDERDIYHEINKLLSDQERTIKRITRNQQDMYGTELLDNLNAESAEYEKQQKLLKSKQKLQQQDLADKRAKLRSSGAEFDANGNVSNYNNLIGNAMNTVNEIISRERGIQEAMNQHLLDGGNTSDEAYKDLELKLTEIGREKSQANDYLNDLKTDLSNYEKVKDEAEDVADQLTEISEKQIEINLKKFNMKLEVTLDLSQATKTWNDYKRNVLQHDDIFNPNKTLSAQKDNAQRLADIDADSRSLNQVNQQIAAAMADNGNLYKTQGQKKKAIEELQKKAIELRKGILDKEDAIKQTYLEQYNIIGEIFDKQKAQYDFINNQLEHNKNMMKLVYGENNYVAQNVYNDKMIENNLKSIESMNNRVKIAEDNLQKARKSGNTAVIEAAEQEWQTAIQNRNQLEEQSAQLLKDRYTTAINQIAHQMEQKLTNGKGFNYLDTQWDLMKKQSNLYLDDINSAFAIKNTEYLYNQVLNDTKGLKSQQQLKKVMNEQLEILKEKDKLTQYDVDRAQKMLEVEKARIALEQARDNKTQMRLKRDSQGNYSYQYVADQDNIAKAENDLAKAENNLYNFDKENYEKSLEEAYNTTKEYQEKIKALNEEYINATEERRKQINEEIRLLEAQYSDYILNLSQETEWGKQNLMESTMINFSNMMNQEQLDFENMSDALKEKWLGDMVPSINSGIAEMISKFSTDPNSFKQIVVEATQAMDNERKTYQQGLAELQKAAGENWNNIKQAMDPVVELQNKLITDNDRLKDQAGEIVDAMNGTLDALKTQADKWQAVYDKTDAAVLRVYDYIKAIDTAALKKTNEENSKTVRDTTNKTVPTVDNLEIYGNTAPGGAGPGNGDKKPVEDREKPKGEKETDSSILSKGLRDLLDIGYIDEANWLHGEFTSEGIEAVQKFAKDYVNVLNWYHGEFTKVKPKTKLKYLDNPIFRESFIEAWNKKYHEKGQKLSKFDTGGYTGDWSSSQGKLAVLHQKELVLNKQDTANMLKMIAMVREMQQQELQFRLSSLNNEIQDVMKQNSQIEKIKSQQELLEQSVAITANFPSVNSKKEIEEALSELMNKATQIALKYKKN